MANINTISKGSQLSRDVIMAAWVGLMDKEELELSNPLNELGELNKTNPVAALIYFFRNPDYLPFLHKHVFGIDVLPMQAAILKELWVRPFPMMVCHRGFGKCINGDTLIVTNNGIKKIRDVVGSFISGEKVYLNNVQILGENGFKKVEYGWCNGKSETIKLTTHNGFYCEGTLNHPVRVVRNSIEWQELSNLKLGDIVVIDRNRSGWAIETNDLSADVAYFLGALIGDGGYTVRGRIGFTTADKELADFMSTVAFKLWNKKFKKYTKYEYKLHGVSIWDELFQKYGFNSSVCGEKDIPSIIWNAPKDAVAKFISGLFDTDGIVTKAIVGFTSKSENLVRNLQFLLTRFGVISRKYRKLDKKYNRYYHHLTITGEAIRTFAEEIGFKLKRKQEKLFKVCEKKCNPNNDVIPDILCKDLLIRLRDKFLQGGNHYRKFPLDGYQAKTYRLTYIKLKKILVACEDFKNEYEYKVLLDILNRKYYFDIVTKLEVGENITYDVYIPGNHSFISNGFISHNSFLLGIHGLSRTLLLDKRKVVVTGAGFRQAKHVFEFAASVWDESSILRDICSHLERQGPVRAADRFVIRLGRSTMTALPLGTGEKIRGERANDIFADEMATVPRDIFETVVAGFGVVAANPVDKVRREELIAQSKILDKKVDDISKTGVPNQIVLSGTAYYEFNHFADYWKRYRKIILSGGDEKKLRDIFGDGDIPNWKDYSVIRVPVSLSPKGFLEERQILRAKATMHQANYNIEYENVFLKDSMGFFRRTLIESCVTNRPIDLPSGSVKFPAAIYGDRHKKYVYGIDPASERDNFAIVIIEVQPDHRRVVYCWTTNKKNHQEKVKYGLVKDQDYYGYCARKIRQLMKVFPCLRIGVDSQGGGIAIRESLHDDLRLEKGEVPIWEIVDENKRKETDDFAGLHILQMIQFADANWVAEANHGLKKDMEDKLLLFPYFDSALIGMLSEFNTVAEKGSIVTYDTLEECFMEIEELKDELASICISRTASGRERWDTPDNIMEGIPKSQRGGQRKDRYSALIIANMLARQLHRMYIPEPHEFVGGVAEPNKMVNDTGVCIGPDWYEQGYIKATNSYGIVNRSR